MQQTLQAQRRETQQELLRRNEEGAAARRRLRETMAQESSNSDSPRHDPGLRPSRRFARADQSDYRCVAITDLSNTLPRHRGPGIGASRSSVQPNRTAYDYEAQGPQPSAHMEQMGYGNRNQSEDYPGEASSFPPPQAQDSWYSPPGSASSSASRDAYDHIAEDSNPRSSQRGSQGSGSGPTYNNPTTGLNARVFDHYGNTRNYHGPGPSSSDAPNGNRSRENR